ncbi:hypothetical protein ACKI1L_38165, partial [Streptomyces scabiei]
LLKGNAGIIESVVSFYKQHFSDHYYIELIRSSRAQEEEYLHLAVELASVEQLPVVATNEVVFLKPENFEAHEIRVAIFDGYTLD